jgi:NADH-quinone oxidoreductase subunit N
MSALVAAPALASEAILFYLVAYAAVNLGAFGVIAALSKDGREPATVVDLAGLAERRPALCAALTVFLVSLTGIPVTAGFVGKFYLFNAAVASGWVVLALVGVITSVVSAYYYLRVVVAMYMASPGRGLVGRGRGPGTAWPCRRRGAVPGIYPAPSSPGPPGRSSLH